MKENIMVIQNLKSKAKNIANQFISFFMQPDLYISYFQKDKIRVIVLCLFWMFFLAVGEIINLIWYFPYHYFFAVTFTIILSIAIYALKSISEKLNEVTTDLADQNRAVKANHMYLIHCRKNTINFIIPLCIVLVFGVGGCLMFGNIELTPALIWFLIYFCITVYFSIVIYLQYIYLAIYLFLLSSSNGIYRHTNKSVVEFIPAQVGWIKNLAKVSHSARNSFFTVGSLYIIAFGVFCFFPNTAADITSVAFYLLWGIIFFAIVIVFPLVSILEFIWIKNIVYSLKMSFINDLSIEQQLSNNSKLVNSIKQLTRTISTIQIINSKDYPISSTWSTCYSFILTFFNFIASIATVLQYISTSQGDFPHIF